MNLAKDAWAPTSSVNPKRSTAMRVQLEQMFGSESDISQTQRHATSAREQLNIHVTVLPPSPCGRTQVLLVGAE
jgi:hypothetical protein